VAEVVAALRARDLRPDLARKWEIVATSGEPLGESMTGRSSTDIAAELAAYLAGRYYSLKGVFPVVPEELLPGIELLRQFFSRVADFGQIFGPGGLIHRIDTFVTSIGNFEQKSLTYRHELVKIGGKSVEELKAIACGDLGGVLIPHDETSPEYTKLDTCWTGIKLSDVRRVAQSGAGAGVVVFAMGANKAEVLLNAVRRGLVTYAVCDHHLACAVAGLLGLSLQPRPR
jgi:DNA-binding transcriptional regulator LsrR (DeoR family)